VRPLAAALLLLAACGKAAPPAARGDSPAYRAWKGSQPLRRLPPAPAASREAGSVEILPPQERAAHPDDFCELFVNGEAVGIFKIGKTASGTRPRHHVPVAFNAGPNTFDLWDSTSDRHYRQSVDTRQAVEFSCIPTAEGYEIRPVPRKP
jgi:hypothetical protein